MTTNYTQQRPLVVPPHNLAILKYKSVQAWLRKHFYCTDQVVVETHLLYHLNTAFA